MLEKEASVYVTTVVSLLTAILGAAAAFGLDVSDAQRNAIIGCVAPLAGVIFLLGPVIRQMVYSKATTEALVDKAFLASPDTGEKPTV